MAVSNFHARNYRAQRRRTEAAQWGRLLAGFVVVLAAMTALHVALAEAAGSTPSYPATGGQDKVTICHAAGRAGTAQYVTITVAYPAAFGQAGHFYENGTPRAGHEDDYMGACDVPISTTVPPTPTVPPTVAPTVPPATVPPTSPPECDWSVIDDTGAEGCLVTTTTTAPTVPVPPVIPVMPAPTPVPAHPEFTG